MSLEKLGRATLKNAIIQYLDSTHSATLTGIISHLPEEIRTNPVAEDREKVVMEIIIKGLIRNGELGPNVPERIENLSKLNHYYKVLCAR